MKKILFTLSVIVAASFASCKKDYQCVCTHTNTGMVHYGDKMEANAFTKKATEETCENNNTLWAGSLKLFDQCTDMDPIPDAAKSRGVPVIEDGAQAIGSGYRGAGTMAEIGCFSFFPSKNLGAFGDAGLVTTNDDAMAEKLPVLRAHGSKPKYFHKTAGGNFRIDALQAALLRPKLRRLDGWTEKRQQNAALYTRLLADANLGDRLTTPVVRQDRHIYNQYILRIPGAGRRDRLQATLRERRIGIYYPVPMHLQQCFRSVGYSAGDFPVAEAASKETLAIPVFPELTETELRTVATVVIHFLRKDG
jgi:dTDP-4-amino-4,6-dideoxygalactose transaminase